MGACSPAKKKSPVSHQIHTERRRLWTIAVMPRRQTNRASKNQLPKLLYDAIEAADVLGVGPLTIVELVQLDELRPTVVIGRRPLFSLAELERFANGPRRKIVLRVRAVDAAPA